ncbi:carboxylating nicotinate-nucleotide diphosphorylase [Catenulispora yoronensis]|uniref:nicotinate-nucleotide diphosphorylase (carboxylating) n=2 Tax=Catenulispora yoronensis TaxID=450799 RepID=A0ABN2UCQ4_9ACTN
MSSLSPDTAKALADAGLDPEYVVSVIMMALDEDLADGPDATTEATVPAAATATADFTARAAGVAAGVPVAAAVFDLISQGTAKVTRIAKDGDRVEAGSVLLTVTGGTRDLLTGERTALNLLCHLSGVASQTRLWVDAVEGTGAKIRDTRKTTPGLRALEKYAVRCGGGVNHRMSLSDAGLVKDNHVVAAGGVVEAFEALRKAHPELPVEVEIDSLDQLPGVLAAGAELILLDNFTPERMRAAVQITGRNELYGRTRLEASGGLTLDQARAVAETGVDYLAVGALTHSAPILDIGSDFREEGK